MRLYRIEHAYSNEGPSYDGLWTDFLEDAIADGLMHRHPIRNDWGDYEQYHSISRGFPTPSNDDFGEPTRYGYCACISAEQLFRWFSPSMCRRLKSAEYVVRLFEVPSDEVQVSKFQALFERDEFEPVEEYDPVADRDLLLAPGIPAAA